MWPFTGRKKRKRANSVSASGGGNSRATALSDNLENNLQTIRQRTGCSPDIIVRQMGDPSGSGVRLAVVFIEGLVDNDTINHSVMIPLMQMIGDTATRQRPPADVFASLRNRFLPVGKVEVLDNSDQLLSCLHAGNAIVLVHGLRQGISAGTAGGDQRGVEEPQSQTVIRGPKEGFTENLRTNTALIRRKIRSPDLWVVNRKIGRISQTEVAVMYLHGVANDKVVDEILKRLDRIETDSILESGYIEEFIQDKTFTPFPTIVNTERPDAIAGAILEGKVAILVDGTPFVLLAPVTIFKMLQSSEDYYQRFDIATFLRLLRYVSFLVSMLLPSFYIAVTTFHQEMLPTTLLISLAAQREGVPFPAFVEALAMEFTFEVLREAGVRMPRAIGSAVSIVGALVLGQAAVQAGLVSAAMVIVVAFTAISNFVAPSVSISNATRLLRFSFMVLAATLGLFGIMAGLIAMLIHLTALRSFGIPYMLPLAPFAPTDQKDVFVRVPWWAMILRPRLISPQNPVREKKSLRPNPPERNDK